jgi:hypothetical protein
MLWERKGRRRRNDGGVELSGDGKRMKKGRRKEEQRVAASCVSPVYTGLQARVVIGVADSLLNSYSKLNRPLYHKEL